MYLGWSFGPYNALRSLGLLSPFYKYANQAQGLKGLTQDQTTRKWLSQAQKPTQVLGFRVQALCPAHYMDYPSHHQLDWTITDTEPALGLWQEPFMSISRSLGIRSVGLFVSPGYIEYLPVGTRFSGMIVLVPHHHHYNGRGFFHENSTTLKEIFRKKKLTCNPPAFKHFRCCNEWVLTQSRWHAPTAVLANMQHGPYQMPGTIWSAFHTLPSYPNPVGRCG